MGDMADSMAGAVTDEEIDINKPLGSETQKAEIERRVDEKGTMSARAEGQVVIGLSVLTQAVVFNNYEKGWRSPGDPPRNVGELTALLHSEVTEFFEAYRNNEPVLWYEYSVPGYVGEPYNSLSAVKGPDGEDVLGKPQGMASELADIIIRVLDTADELEIPVIQAILEKHKYNQTRAYRHGSKQA